VGGGTGSAETAHCGVGHYRNDRTAPPGADPTRWRAPLEGANACPIDLCPMRKLFLRQVRGPPIPSQIKRQYPSYIHARERTAL
jgi:hypothetical protein